MSARALMSALCLVFCSGTVLGESLQGIHVSGVGEVRVVPDLAHVALQVSYRDKDANVAKTEVDRITQSVLEQLRKLRIKERDVTAASIRLNPIYDRRSGEEPRVREMQAGRDISIVVRNLDKVGDVVNSAVRLGVNHIQRIRLDTSRKVEFERQALDLAIADAKREGAHVADQFDVTLGALLNVHVSQQSASPEIASAALLRSSVAAGGGDLPFAPGELRVVRSVQASFAIDAP